MQYYEDQAEDWLRSVAERAEKGCQWCRHPSQKIYRASLCRHCYDIRLHLNRLQKRVDAAKHKYGPNWASRLDTLDLDYKAALLMVKSAKIEGVQYLRYYSDRTTPLELETEFRWLSTRFLHKNVFNHDAYLFEKLSPVNRRFVMYLVSRLTRDDRRRNRRNIARNIAFQDELEQIESARPKRLSGAQ